MSDSEPQKLEEDFVPVGRWKWGRRFLLAAVLILVLCAATIWLLARVYLQPERIKVRIEKELSAMARAPVTLGSVNVSGRKIVVRDARAAWRPVHNVSVNVQVDAATLKIKWLPLLVGRLSLRSLELEHVLARIRRQGVSKIVAGGRPSMKSGRRQSGTAVSQHSSPLRETESVVPKRPTAECKNRSAKKPAKARHARLWIDQFVVRDAEIDFDDLQEDVSFRREGVVINGAIGFGDGNVYFSGLSAKFGKSSVGGSGWVNLKKKLAELDFQTQAVDMLLMRPYVTVLRAFRRHQGVPVDASGHISWKGDTWRIGKIKCLVKGGTVTGAVDVDAKGKEPVFLVEVHAKDVHVEPPVILEKRSRLALTGTVSLDGRFRLRGRNEEALRNSLTGEAGFIVRNGALESRVFRAIMKRVSELTKIRTKPVYELIEAKGSFRAENRKFVSDNTRLHGPLIDFRMIGDGWVDFDGNICCDLLAKVKGKIPVPIHVSRTLEHPKVKVDLDPLKKLLEQDGLESILRSLGGKL